MEKTFYSNGKLLITGEYVVLDGAKSLALPTKFGQSLIVKSTNSKKISWKSFDSDGSIWFETEITFQSIINNEIGNNNAVQNTLIEILHEAHLLNLDLLQSENGFEIETHLTFPRKWGLGTSSTLINNIAQWFKVDAFKLLKNSFGGSGYDIACAQNNTPILYQIIDKKPTVTPLEFSPEHTKNLYFVYLNQKQDSKEGIKAYRKQKVDKSEIFDQINAITENILKTQDLKCFESLLQQHENTISNLLQIKTVKESLFPDFKGTLKSLGAWGGDFILAVSEENPTEYFKSKGYESILTYREMIL